MGLYGRTVLCSSSAVTLPGLCCRKYQIFTEPLLGQGLHWIVNVEATLTNRDEFLFSTHIYWIRVQGLIHTHAAKRRKGTSQGSFTIEKRRDKAVFLVHYTLSWIQTAAGVYFTACGQIFQRQGYVTQIVDDMNDVCLHGGFCFMHQMKQHIVLQSLWFSTIFHEEGSMVFAEGFTFRWTWELDDNFDLSSVSYQLEGKLSLEKGGIDMII